MFGKKPYRTNNYLTKSDTTYTSTQIILE